MWLTKEQSINAIASFWANSIGGESDVGDLQLNTLISVLKETEKDSSVSEKFRQALLEVLYGMRLEDLDLFVDYRPSELLANVANKTGVDEYDFPFKTSMFIYENGDSDLYSIEVKEGYEKRAFLNEFGKTITKE